MQAHFAKRDPPVLSEYDIHIVLLIFWNSQSLKQAYYIYEDSYAPYLQLQCIHENNTIITICEDSEGENKLKCKYIGYERPVCSTCFEQRMK